nr:MarR family transcriptional regulator [Ardenticatena sp.]
MSNPIPEETRDLAVRFLRVLEALHKVAPYKLDHEVAEQLHINHWRMLHMLKREPGLAQKEIAERLGVTPAAVSQAMRVLERLALIERVPDENDSRFLRLYLSERGHAILQTMLEARMTRVAQLLRALAPDQQHLVVELLEQAVRQSSQQTTSVESRAEE